VGPKGGGKQLILVKRPDGAMKPSDFSVVETSVPTEVAEGEAIVQNVMLSLDPTHRIWASADKQYMPAVGLNTVMRAGTVGKVIKSSDEKALPVGSFVSAFGGVQEYVIAKISDLHPVVPGVPLSYNLSIFSAIIGLTAWVGSNICEVKPGETVVVSGAAGAVGSAAAQIMKNRGATVIGIAGSDDKCKWLTELGLAGVINYKTEDVPAKLKELCPNGVNAYFDNVGGAITEAVMHQCNNFARVAFCGFISGYESSSGITATLNCYELMLIRRIKVQGFVCVDHIADMGKCIEEVASYVKAGTLKFKEDIQEVPIEAYVDTVNKLYTGENTGKLIMQITAF
jgi:NADPH-dependent curcumin reductase CurA